jgi:hypothetical protein
VEADNHNNLLPGDNQVVGAEEANLQQDNKLQCHRCLRDDNE